MIRDSDAKQSQRGQELSSLRFGIEFVMGIRPARVTFSRSILKSQKFVPKSLSVLDNGTKLETETQEIDSAGILIPLAISDLIVTEIEEPIAVLEFNEAVLV
ncbi:hypothetical protein L1887_22513 [Cichorium endivia]|nr:hypothetical protein L1887_22513 [Cichorium endivia]